MLEIERPLGTAEVRKLTGWSLIKIRKLIQAGKLPAINSSPGDRPRWEVLPSDLARFLAPERQSAVPIEPIATRRRRIDADVPKRF